MASDSIGIVRRVLVSKSAISEPTVAIAGGGCEIHQPTLICSEA